MALISFLTAKGDGAICALDWKPEERRWLAKKSVDFFVPLSGNCSLIKKNLMERIDKTNKKTDDGVNKISSDRVDGLGSRSKFRDEI